MKYTQLFRSSMFFAFLLATITMILAGASSHAGVTSQEFQVEQVVTFDRDALSFGSLDGFDTVTLAGCDFMTSIGDPRLPSQEVRVALPAGMTAESIRVVSTINEPISGEYTIFPSQAPRRVGVDYDGAVLAEPKAATYGSHTAWPTNLVQLVRMTDLAGQGMAVVRINPVQYIPAEKQLILLSEIRFVIEGCGGYACGDYLPMRMSERTSRYLDRAARGMVINPDEVVLRPSDEPQTTGVSAGDYDYVIITTSTWVTTFQALADWKTQKGVPATIVTTDWIYNYGGYSGSNQEKIQDFVQDAYSTWGAMYFLIGGDTGTVPAHTRSMSGDTIYNDSFYGDYDWDWTTEVHVGRASVTSTTAINTFIDKVLTYEQDPPTSNYAKTIGLFGFDLDGSTDGEDCVDYIGDNYVPTGWTRTNIYDSQSTNHETAVKNAINGGLGLIAHVDHCYEDSIGVGSTNHGWDLSKTEVDAFYNGDEQAIFYSIGCWPAAFDYSSCIAERYTRDTNGGGFFVGNDRYGWYSYGSTSTYSMLYCRYFFRSLFDQGHFVLGDCFSDHKNDSPTSDSTYQYIYAELNILGDPEMPIWTEDPDTVTSVTYDDPIAMGSQSFTVTVANGGTLTGYTVCLWKDGEIYEVGSTNSLGQETFTIAPMTNGTMTVTACKHNVIPWEGTCTVSGSVPTETLSVSMSAVPDTGVLPFSSTFWVTLTNLTTQNRRAAARVNVALASGSSVNNWKSGWTNLSSEEAFSTNWSQSFPGYPSLLGDNVFTLFGEDVTQAPYNQPPYSPSGYTDTSVVTVTGTN